MTAWCREMVRLCARASACAAIALSSGACSSDAATPVASDDQMAMTSDAVGYGTQTTLTSAEGIRSGLIRADTAYFFEDSATVHMRGVAMTIYTETGAVRATVTARSGEYMQRDQRMHALGDVVLVFPNDDRRVESGELYYNPSDGRIWSDSATTYHNERGETTRGSCFNSDLEFKNLTVCNIRGSAEIAGQRQ